MTYAGYLPLAIQRYLDGLKMRRVARCHLCRELFVQEHDEALCPGCKEGEDQMWADHCDDVAAAMAATNGTL